MEQFFDDERVTLGDGAVDVEMGIHGVQKVSGSRGCVRDPRLSRLGASVMDLPPLWKAPTQMAQVAPGAKWCAGACGDVRPLSYFDVKEWDKRGKPTKWNDKGNPIEWDGVPFPTKWHHECKMCANERDPKLRPTKYCSGCKQEKSRHDFGVDLRNADELQSHCKACEAKRSAQRYRDRVGREVRSYTYRS